MDLLNGETHAAPMRRCIELALIARQLGDSPVGSALVLEGRIIGEGIEGGRSHRDITFHAEIEAIRRATEFLGSQDLSGCVLYTTHEPCIMCSYVIRQAGIGKVVMALESGETGGAGSVYPVLLDGTIKKWGAPPELVRGFMERECRELLG